jgi:hypothetical protein
MNLFGSRWDFLSTWTPLKEGTRPSPHAFSHLPSLYLCCSSCVRPAHPDKCSPLEIYSSFSDRTPPLHSTTPSEPEIPRIPLSTHRVPSHGRKAWKTNKKTKRLILGDGVGLDNLCEMSLCTLVGRISYKSLNTPPLEDWLRTEWAPLIGYCPEVLYLKKGWLGFLCRTPEDATLLLSFTWVLGEAAS